MKDKTLYYICLFFSLCSILALFIYSYNMEPERMKIGNIETSNIGEEVKIKGIVKDTYSSDEGHFFFHVKDETGEISSVVFKDDFETMGLEPGELKEGEKVKIEGEIETYNRNLQILPEKIIL